MQNSSITNWHVVGGREMAISNEAWLTLTPWDADLATQPENHRLLTCTTNGMFTQSMIRYMKTEYIFNFILLARIEGKYLCVGCTCLWKACHCPKMNIPCQCVLFCWCVQTFMISQQTEFGTNGPMASSSSPRWSCPSWCIRTRVGYL